MWCDCSCRRYVGVTDRCLGVTVFDWAVLITPCAAVGGCAIEMRSSVSIDGYFLFYCDALGRIF